MADEIKNQGKIPVENSKEKSTEHTLKSAIKTDKRKLIIYSELLKPKF